MDYNDNDYEGQNLHLTGEESSKIYSVLRPFALPKFDFDDSLHGHLRFDSLVENKVFLGIPSQEGNQWIEDFSRGSSGIVFCSSAAESCALPRHINVWSEATSSESVEMLLKAVRQEEMVPCENLMEESESGDQLGSSTLQIENNVSQDAKIDDGIGHGNPSLPLAEVEGNICRSNQSAGVEVIQTEYDLQDAKIDDSVDCEDSSLPRAEFEGDICMSNQSVRVERIQAEYDLEDAKIDNGIDCGNSSLLPAEVEGNICRSNQSAVVEVVPAEYDFQAESNVSIYELCDDVNDGRLTENSANPKTELKGTSDNRMSTCGLVNESLSTHDQDNIHVLCTGIGIEKTENSSQNIDVSVKDSFDQEKIIDISFVSPSFATESIFPMVEEPKEGCKKGLDGSAIENDDTERHCFHEFPSEIESPKQEHSDEMCINNLAELSSVPRIAEIVSTRDRFNEDSFIVEPSGVSQHILEVFSSGTEIKQLSEGHIILHENSSVSLQGEGVVGLEVEDSDAVISTNRGNTELHLVPVNQQSYQNHTTVGSEDFHPGSHNSFDARHASFEVLGTPSDKVGGVNHADGSDNAAGSNFDCGSCGEKSVINGMNDAGDTAAVQKENVLCRGWGSCCPSFSNWGHTYKHCRYYPYAVGCS